jgi:hypothetical protein
MPITTYWFHGLTRLLGVRDSLQLVRKIARRAVDQEANSLPDRSQIDTPARHSNPGRRLARPA